MILGPVSSTWKSSIRTEFWMTSGGTSVTFWDPMPVGQGQDKRTLSFAKFAQYYICHMHRPN